ncbi:MAG TPA: NUDIX hydrolase [Thermoanaerobaculia bacterium]|nr:NUDIX hydrolase [Thermoanaerobaculia bacterium]
MSGSPAPLDAPREALRAALRAHAPADEAEGRDRAAMLALVEDEPACFSRATFAPGHFTGSLFVLSADGRVLLHHHRRLDRWLQMGGHDEGEHDPAATALREGREESGLGDLALLSPAILDLDVHPIPAAKGEPPHAHFDVRYAAITREPSSARIDEAESLGLAWLPLAEAGRRMGEPGALRALAKAARLLALVR